MKAWPCCRTANYVWQPWIVASLSRCTLFYLRQKANAFLPWKFVAFGKKKKMALQRSFRHIIKTQFCSTQPQNHLNYLEQPYAIIKGVYPTYKVMRTHPWPSSSSLYLMENFSFQRFFDQVWMKSFSLSWICMQLAHLTIKMYIIDVTLMNYGLV